MAKQSPSSGSPKNKDDDSWGKLYDLLGIQLGGPDDDFDLPDEESPPAKPVADETPAPVAAPESKPVVVQQTVEPDLSFPEDDEVRIEADAERVVETVAAEEASADEREQNEPDIWDQLESWNWEEPAKSAPRMHGDVPPGRGGDRSGRRGSGGPPRDHEGGRDRSRGREEERPRPPRDAAASAAAGPAAEPTPRERPPRREDAPRREDRPRRSDSRDEAPRTEQRPARQPDSTEQRPPRAIAPRPTAPATPDDGFAAGLDDEPQPRHSAPAPSRTAPPAAARPVRQPAPEPTPTRAKDDDFAVDLFQELAREADEAGTETSGNAGESGAESSNDDRPRRRRRRRRGGRGRRPETVGGQTDAEDGPEDGPEDVGEGSESGDLDDDESFAFASDDDSSSDDADDSETSGTSSEGTDEEGGEQRRPRRRRRRGRGRPDERPVEGAVVGASSRSDSEEEDDDDDEIRDEPQVRSERVEEEPLAPVNYEGIPTWEEAISYLIRTRGPEPRGRGHGGPRGRGGPPHRR